MWDTCGYLAGPPSVNPPPDYISCHLPTAPLADTTLQRGVQVLKQDVGFSNLMMAYLREIRSDIEAQGNPVTNPEIMRTVSQRLRQACLEAAPDNVEKLRRFKKLVTKCEGGVPWGQMPPSQSGMTKYLADAQEVRNRRYGVGLGLGLGSVPCPVRKGPSFGCLTP